jgi:hypothetical protein
MSNGPRIRSAAAGALLWLGGLSSAAAAPFYVESAGYLDREAAQAQLLACSRERPGVGRAQVVRRYVRNEGWRYLVHVDDVGTAADAKALAAVFGAGAVAVDLESGVAIVGAPSGARVDGSPPPAPSPPPAAARPAPPAAPPAAPEATSPRPPPGPALVGGAGLPASRESDGLLRAAAKAHGGVDGGAAVLRRADQITFRYTRRVPSEGDELVASHLWRAAPAGIRLDVDVQRGAGVDSITVAASQGPSWVDVAGVRTDRDPTRAKEVLQRFGPADLLQIPLTFAADVDQARAWSGLTVAGPEGERLVVLRADSEGAAGLVEAALYREDHRLARVVYRRGAELLTYRFSDYSEAARGLVVPGKVRVEADGELIEEITIEGLDLRSTVPASLFSR